VKPLFKQVLRETENNIDINNLPVCLIEINADENSIIFNIRNSKTNNERKTAMNSLKKYYKDFFKQNYENKSTINDAAGIEVKLVNTGLNHCFQQGENYYLWPAIRYLSSIIKIATYMPETSQHINDPNTTHGDIAHIFYCKGDYIFNSENKQIKETHVLRISAVTFKEGSQNNFRHISKLDENQTNIIAKLISIEIQ
jgi:hypothetical protein